MIFIREVPLCRCPVLQALCSVQPLVESDDSPALTLSCVPAMNIEVILTEMGSTYGVCIFISQEDHSVLCKLWVFVRLITRQLEYLLHIPYMKASHTREDWSFII